MEKLDLIAGATIALDKPLTWSSFSLVNKFRCEACRYLGIKKLKVGHAGTLDPLATGVMILCTGKHTKRIDELQASSPPSTSLAKPLRQPSRASSAPSSKCHQPSLPSRSMVAAPTT